MVNFGGNQITQEELLGLAFQVSMSFDVEAAELGIEITYEDNAKAKRLAKLLDRVKGIPSTVMKSTVLVKYDRIAG